MGGKGSGKKKEIELPKEKPKKKMVKKFKCKIEGQSKDFNNQKDAREMAIKVLETGYVFFLELSQVNVEEDQKMPKRKKYVEKKAVEEFDAKDWEAAYNQLNVRFDNLKNKMRKAMNCISQAQNYLSEAVL